MDRAFNEMAQKAGVQAAFAHYAAPDAVLLMRCTQRGVRALVDDQYPSQVHRLSTNTLIPPIPAL